MTINERVKVIRKSKQINMTLEKFGERIGLKKNSVSQIETGTNALSEQNIKAICREFNVNEDWLRNGTGDPFNEPTDGVEALLEEMKRETSDEFYRAILELARTYQQLSDSSRETLREFGRKYLANMNRCDTEQTKTPIPFRLISYYYKNASAGTGKLIIDNVPEDDIEIPDIPEYRNVSYAIGVNGDSMEPTYQDGDILLVEATQEIRIGEIGIFQVDGEAYVKKLGETELISLNQEYANIPLDESARTMGRVIDKLNV